MPAIISACSCKRHFMPPSFHLLTCHNSSWVESGVYGVRPQLMFLGSSPMRLARQGQLCAETRGAHLVVYCFWCCWGASHLVGESRQKVKWLACMWWKEMADMEPYLWFLCPVLNGSSVLPRCGLLISVKCQSSCHRGWFILSLRIKPANACESKG